MSEIKRLIRVTAARNEATEYTSGRYRVLRRLHDRFKSKAAQESISPNVVLEAMIRGYINDHPAVLAMIEQWIKDEGLEKKSGKGAKPANRELDEIYSAIADGGMIVDEENEP